MYKNKKRPKCDTSKGKHMSNTLNNSDKLNH